MTTFRPSHWQMAAVFAPCALRIAARQPTRCTTRRLRAQLLSRLAQQEFAAADPAFVDLSEAPASFDPLTLAVYPNVCTDDEEEIFLQDLQVKLKRQRYQKGHWDTVIQKYKETELSDEENELSDSTRALMQRIRDQLQRHAQHPSTVEFLPSHAIDLHAEGKLNAHTDSIRYSGDIVAGLSLLSSSIMRFVPADGDGHVDAWLPRRSLYVMMGMTRYEYTHELLPDRSSFAGGPPISRERRVSIIFRDTRRQVRTFKSHQKLQKLAFD